MRSDRHLPMPTPTFLIRMRQTRKIAPRVPTAPRANPRDPPRPHDRLESLSAAKMNLIEFLPSLAAPLIKMSRRKLAPDPTSSHQSPPDRPNEQSPRSEPYDPERLRIFFRRLFINLMTQIDETDANLPRAEPTPLPPYPHLYQQNPHTPERAGLA